MTPKKRQRVLQGFAAILISAVVTVVVIFAYEPVIQALTPREEPFTELYFEDHLHLPKTMVVNTPIKLAFTIHNLEGIQMTYPIRVFAQDESTPPQVTELMKTQVTIEQDQSKTIPVEFAIPQFTTPRQKITVELEQLQQTIHLWAIVASPSATPQPTPRR
jgi:hypothetical protein